MRAASGWRCGRVNSPLLWSMHYCLPPMSPVKSPVAVAHLSCPQVTLVYPCVGDWCAPVPYDIFIVAAVDVPNIPTGCHQGPSPEPPYGHLPHTLATCILVHVAPFHAPPEALHQYLLSPARQHHYQEEVWPRVDHAPCRCPRQRDSSSLQSLHYPTHPIRLAHLHYGGRGGDASTIWQGDT
jgi:hypothetical protein